MGARPSVRGVTPVDVRPLIPGGFPDGVPIAAPARLVTFWAATDKLAIIASFRRESQYFISLKIKETNPDFRQCEKTLQQIPHPALFPDHIHASLFPKNITIIERYFYFLNIIHYPGFPGQVQNKILLRGPHTGN
jgi:hypothetical protein